MSIFDDVNNREKTEEARRTLKKGGVTFEGLERGKLLLFER